jgi:type I restriction enzyme S subunit
VRPGYKQTELEEIPAEWELKPFRDLFTFQNGVNADKAAYGRGVQFINVLEPITYSHIHGPEITGRVTLSESVISSYAVKHGDVLFNRTSETENEIGLAATYVGAERVVFGGFVIRGRPTGEALDPLYSGYALRAPIIRSQIIPMAQGAVRANIGQEKLMRVLAPIPPHHEQRAIAAALSDMDALLGGLDQLIAKKRDIKQAAMQQLLTGQTRLPGFSGEWEVKRLGEIAHIKTGSRNNEDKVEDGAHPFYVRSDVVERINSYSYDCEAILVPGEGRIGSIFHYIQGRFDVHQRVYAVTQFGPGVSGKFVHLYMAMNFGAWAMQNTVKATVDSLRLPTFQTFQIRMPTTKGEQTAIATVLSDMDAELEALEQRRAKTAALKQAMMQELLTGRTRLLKNQMSEAEARLLLARSEI